MPTAAQVAGMLCEMARIPGARRAGTMMQCFAPTATVTTLATGATTCPDTVLAATVTDIEALLQEGGRCDQAAAAKRVFIEHGGPDAALTFCFDVYRDHHAPSWTLQGKSQALCLLYRCENGRLTHVWVGADTEGIAELDRECLCACEAWEQARTIMTHAYGGTAHGDSAAKCTLSDYERAGADKLGLGLGTTSHSESWALVSSE